jgi:hypothetical protein
VKRSRWFLIAIACFDIDCGYRIGGNVKILVRPCLLLACLFRRRRVARFWPSVPCFVRAVLAFAAHASLALQDGVSYVVFLAPSYPLVLL